MESTRFQVYKTNAKYMKFYLVFCVVMTCAGLTGLISELAFDYRFFNLQTTVFVFLALQGAFGIYISRKNIESNKYFVSWDKNQISYHLPNTNEPINIRLSEIRKVERGPQKIRIELNNSEIEYFSFNYFYFPHRATILSFFEELKDREKTIE